LEVRAGLGKTIRVLGRVMAAFRGRRRSFAVGNRPPSLEQDGFRMVGIKGLSRPDILMARGMHRPRNGLMRRRPPTSPRGREGAGARLGPFDIGAGRGP